MANSNQPRPSFRDLESRDDVDRYISRLTTEWPERAELMRHIADQVEGLPFSEPHVVELCAGPGLLAETLLTRMPQLTYTGLDFSAPLLASAQHRLAGFDQRAKLIRVDLNQDGWPSLFSDRVQAVVSMQSLHDLGDESRVDRIYRLAKDLLVEGGLFLNADLTVLPGQDKPNNPGRRSVPRHLELLQSCGYRDVACTFTAGEFGCVVGFAGG